MAGEEGRREVHQARRAAAEVARGFTALIVLAATASFAACVTVRGPIDEPNEPPMQRWAEDVAGTPLPQSARTRDAFDRLEKSMTFPDALRIVGPPTREVFDDDAEKSGVLHVYAWPLENGDEIRIATPELQTLEWMDLATRNGKEIRLLQR